MKDVGDRLRDVLARIDRVAELVQHRGHPVFVGDNVGEHADVAGAVDVGAECVRAFAGPLVQVAAG
jgi:vancomycin permeability regulator SanA